MDRRSFLCTISAAGLGLAGALPGRAQIARDQTGPGSARALYVDLERTMLYAIEGTSIVLVSRVIVGARGTPTPHADSALSHVRFRPTWRPTPRMVATGHYEDGLRPPGAGNPLGLAAIHFRGGGLVYLHGTNQPHLFERERRQLSNGCVRVEQLVPLVGWVLGWSEEAVRQAMHGRRTFDAPTWPIPFRMATEPHEPMLGLLDRIAQMQAAPAWAG